MRRAEGPALVVISGLPGVGKTSVARALAQQLGAVHLSVDALEEAMLGCGLPRGWSVGVAAYETARAAAELNLGLGRDVIVDAVNDSEEARGTWHRAWARPAFVLLTCSDAAEHRGRLSGRDRGFAHVTEPTWEQVTDRRAAYAPWTGPVIEVETAGRTVGDVADFVLRALAQRR